jgi:hypothetical protein
MAKILSTIGFLATTALVAWLGTLAMKRSLRAIRGTPANQFINYMVDAALLLSGFVQYWLLTRVFPLRLILALLGAYFIYLVIHGLAGSVAGFTLEEKQRKVAALRVIWAVQQQKLGCTYTLASIVLFLASVLVPLWTFWKHPIGDPKAKVLITVFVLLLPQVFVSLWRVVISWWPMTSEYVDDDLRNAELSTQFSGIIYATISLVFPFWIIEQEIRTLYGTFPFFWLLLSFPLAVFLVGVLLPFFIGANKFRTQVRVMLEWRREWLKGLLELLKLPVGGVRLSGLDQKLHELKDEINDNVSRNRLFAFYQKVLKDDPAGRGKFLGVPDVAEFTPAELPVSSDSAVPAKDEQAPSLILANVLRAKDALKGMKPVEEQTPDEVSAQVVAIVRENRTRLVEWDARFAHTKKLLDMYQVCADARTADIRESIQFQLDQIDKELAAMEKRKNILAGSSLAAITALISWLFKTFEHEIVSFVRGLVGTH